MAAPWASVLCRLGVSHVLGPPDKIVRASCPPEVRSSVLTGSPSSQPRGRGGRRLRDAHIINTNSAVLA
eukprot:scaffold38490_cov62-Phaeocystis_antarctica.AAC.3